MSKSANEAILKVLLLCLVAFCTGFGAALTIHFFLGAAKAHHIPGGSIAAGFVTGLLSDRSAPAGVLGALCGLFGFLLYYILIPV